MRLKRIRHVLLQAYLWVALTITLVVGLFGPLPFPGLFDSVVRSANLAILIVLTISIPALILMIFDVRSISSYSSLERRVTIVYFILMSGLSIIAFGLIVSDAAGSPQDVATLAIVWAVVVAGLLFVGKNLLSGILGAIGGALVKLFLDKVTRSDDKNTDDKNTSDKTTAQN